MGVFLFLHMTIQEIHHLFLKSDGISTDTRAIRKNTLFFALKGANFNGNTFADQALASGASYAIVDEEAFDTGDKTILVTDVLKTLQELAYTHRKYLDIPILALTGSNGKTTTKELINKVLSKKFNTTATQGNLNNHIGVPLTLLSMTKNTEIGIVEMGANHIGEIAELAAIAAPDFGYITNFGKAHLEGFGSVEGVIQGKSELYEYLIAHKGTLFLNLDDPIQAKKVKSTHSFCFSAFEDADTKIVYQEAQPFANFEFDALHVQSNLMGQYNTINLAAAATIGMFFKIDKTAIKEALESYIPTNNRSQIINKGKQTIILDAYNANPTSMAAALQNFSALKGANKIAFLGDMFELGDTAHEEHQIVADTCANLNIDYTVFLGKNFGKVKTSGYKYENLEALQKSGFPEVLQNKLKEATILIKGSRGMKLEGLLDLLDSNN